MEKPDDFTVIFCRIFETEALLLAPLFEEFCELNSISPNPKANHKLSMATRRYQHEVDTMRAHGWMAHPRLVNGRRVWTRLPMLHEHVVALRARIDA